MEPQKTVGQGSVNAANWMILIVLALIWGTSFILIKRGLAVFPYNQVGAIRIVAAFLCLLPFAILKWRQIPKEKWKYVLAMGMLGNFIPAFLFAKAQTQLPSSLTGVLNALTPLLTMIVGVVAFQNKFETKQLTGLLVAFVGAALLSLVGDAGGFGSFNWYVVFVFIAALCYSTSTNIIKAHLTQIPSLVLTSVAISMVGVMGLLYLFTTDFLTIVRQNPQEAWPAIGYLSLLGVMSTAVALVLFNKMIQQTSAVFASTVTYLIPIVAVGWGVWDGEQLFALHYLAMLLILIGVFWSNKK